MRPYIFLTGDDSQMTINKNGYNNYFIFILFYFNTGRNPKYIISIKLNISINKKV